MHKLWQFPLAVIGYLLFWLPEPIFVSLGKATGNFLCLVGFRKSIIKNNLKIAFPELSDNERNSLMRKNYHHYGMLLLEFFISFGPYAKYLEQRCTVEGEAYLREALAGGKGTIVTTGHLGNWEVITTFGSWVLDVPVTIVTKKLKPQAFHDFFEAVRGKVNTKGAYEPKTLPIVLRTLKAGEIVGIACDQYAGAPVGARVPYFGVPVGTHTALAVIALRTGVPVVPGFAIRNPNGRYTIKFMEPLRLKKEGLEKQESIIYATAKVTEFMESWVRKHPEQWLWIHRRWKGDLSPLPEGSIGQLLNN